MLVKMMTHAETLKEYKDSIKKRSIVFAAMAVLGLLMTSSGFGAFMTQMIQNDHHSGFISGIGAGLGICGVLLLIQNQKLLKDEKKLKKQWIEENDERNRLVTLKTMSTAGMWAFGLVYAALIVSFFLDMKVFLTLAAVVAAVIICLIGSRMYYERKM